MKLILITLVGLVVGMMVACSASPKPSWIIEDDTPSQSDSIPIHSNSSYDEYVSKMMTAFERQWESRDACERTRDQKCLTRSVEQLRDTVGVDAPDWISNAHRRLYLALSELARVHQLSNNPDNRTPALFESILAADDEYQVAAAEWARQAKR